MKRKKNRGGMLMELVIAITVIGIMFSLTSGLFSTAYRMAVTFEIQSANVNALATEISRLRSLPLSSFYEADGITLKETPLRYYRRLSMPGSSVKGHVFARFDVSLLTPRGVGGPVQVIVSVQPVYLPTDIGADPVSGLGRITGATSDKIPNGINLAAMTETQSFIVL